MRCYGFFQFGTGIANMFAVTLLDVVRRIYDARHGASGGFPRGKSTDQAEVKRSVTLIKVGRPGAGASRVRIEDRPIRECKR